MTIKQDIKNKLDKPTETTNNIQLPTELPTEQQTYNITTSNKFEPLSNSDMTTETNKVHQPDKHPTTNKEHDNLLDKLLNTNISETEYAHEKLTTSTYQTDKTDGPINITNKTEPTNNSNKSDINNNL